MRAARPPRRLRDRFDEAPHPDPQGLPETHHRDFYLATDASDAGRLGVLIETLDGVRVGEWSRMVPVLDNNEAELYALHWGLDVLAGRAPPTARVGILVDHDVIGDAVARAIGYSRAPERPIRSASPNHWGGILAGLHRFAGVRVAVVSSGNNPAHEVATRRIGNDGAGYPDRCVRPAADRIHSTPPGK